MKKKDIKRNIIIKIMDDIRNIGNGKFDYSRWNREVFFVLCNKKFIGRCVRMI